MISIRKSLVPKLSLGILLLAVPVFVIALGLLFNKSRQMIREEAVGHANSVLGTTMKRVVCKLGAVETATHANSWLVKHYMQPDSLVTFTHRVVQLNPHVDGCSVSTEPGVFPKFGRYFSTYSISQADTVATVIEEEYEYFDRIWYKTPKDEEKPCWVVYFDDVDTLTLALDGMVASYCMPLYDDADRFFGVITSDFSLLRLSKVIEEERPYPNSYFMMIDKDGYYYVHPDSARLFTQTIFSDADPRQQAGIIALGHEMTKGKQGNMAVTIDGVHSLVSYQPVPGTTWSLALVCPDKDILEDYHRLTYIVVPLLIIGLLLILLLCDRVVAHAIMPLNQLLEKTQSIASGNMEVYIPRSPREDVVGRLQNSFATMLQSLNFHMGSVRYTTDQAKRRNEELLQATRLVEEADRQKTVFIQNVSHQVRTPLNIIMGFAQILNGSFSALPEEEMKSITSMMDYNSKLLNRLLLMLFDSSETGTSEELIIASKHEDVSCNDVAREAISYIKRRYPDLFVNFQSDVDDDFCICTNRIFLMRSLRELLYNSAKYSDGQHVAIRISHTDTTVRFVVEDRGKGIAEADRERLFKFFTKVDDLSEGLGLGLPLSKRHAQNLGGDLFLDVSYHDGCRFILEIPLTYKKSD